MCEWNKAAKSLVEMKIKDFLHWKRGVNQKSYQMSQHYLVGKVFVLKIKQK